MSLLQKGHKYNLHNESKNWIQNLALGTETTISHLPLTYRHLPLTYRDVYRKLAAEHISTLQKNNNPLHTHTHSTHQETRLIKSIKTKLKENKAMITCADKGNSLVILPTEKYDSKIADFIRMNDFQTTTKDPTKFFQSQIRRVRNYS